MRLLAPFIAVLPFLTACAGKETNFTNADDGSNLGAGTTELTLSPDPIVIVIPDSEDALGVSYSVPFVVTNIGDSELRLYNIDLADSAGGVFDMQDVEDKTVPIGGEREYVLVAALPDRTQATGLLRVKANASGWQDARVDIIACVEGACDLTGDDGTGGGTGGTGTGGDGTGGGTSGDGTGGDGTGGGTGSDGTGGGTTGSGT